MNTTAPQALLDHADAIDHAAALGGWRDDRTGVRMTLDQTQRDAWHRDAAVLREAAHQAQARGQA